MLLYEIKKMKEKILITCFEPFGGEEKNSSMAVAEALPAELAGREAVKLILPVEFARAAEIAEAKARETGAKYIISLGQAGARSSVTPELVAINLNHAAIPDNAGKNPKDEPIAEGGSTAYFTRFPARLLAAKINEYGVPSALSYSAGVYVCNDLYYRLLAAFENEDVTVLFVHVPREKNDVSAEKMAFALEKALEDIFKRA
ncbi:MAG: pyroglutamyl-peptidase I [Clostridia bacterium]|nr:pyroglutamyl-peptidase I [Clostridia bacterium]